MTEEQKEKIIKIVKRGKEERLLETDFDVLLKIYELTEIKHEIAYFSKLVEQIDAGRDAISINLDKLFDLCLIYGKWEKHSINEKPQWVRAFYVDEDFLPYAKGMYNCKLDGTWPPTKETIPNNKIREMTKRL